MPRSSKRIHPQSSPSSGDLLERIVSILESSRVHVVRTVNFTTVTTYWHIGRELVEALQEGEARAAYGKALIARLAEGLTLRFGPGYSSTNLAYFRQFYLCYRSRNPHPPGTEREMTVGPENFHPVGGNSTRGFHAKLSWSHYRALMRVADEQAREFYEDEAARSNWSRRELDRQISSLYHQRRLASTIPHESATRTDAELRPVDMLKDPYVLEFLDLPSSPMLHESEFEDAIITRLQQFLLELGRGFSFVARQQRLRFADKDFYVDLVFYNYLLKCFVLVDLKIGELTHQDIGQMDGYVRLYQDQHRIEGDNPTIGLILCSERNDAVARYSVLHESQQLFASRYRFTLPTEEELQYELRRERALLENQHAHPHRP